MQMDVRPLLPLSDMKKKKQHTFSAAKTKPPSLAKHFVNILIITFMAILTSILLGVFIGAAATTGGSDLGVQVLVASVVHALIFYVAFNTVVFDAFATRLNPYVTIIDLLLENTIDVRIAVVEIAAQATAAVGASALMYALVENSSLTYVGSSGIPIASEGIGFLGEMISSALMAWSIFSNRKFGARDRTRMALAISYIIGVSAAIVFPFIGLTTHSIFRWLANCVPSGTCGALGSWIFPIGPLVGIPLGYGAHKLTE